MVFYVRLMLGYVLCEVYVMETWNSPGTKGDIAQLLYFDKVAGGQSTLVLAFKLGTRREFQWTVFKRCE